MHRLRAASALLIAAGLFLIGMAAAADAEMFTVTRTDDPVPGPCLPGDCSLREALHASNASTTVDDVVVVPAAAAHYRIDLGSLGIDDQVVVRGAGADRVVLDAGGNSITVGIGGPGVVLEGLAITGGLGGIQNNGELTLRRVSIEHNDRTDGGGGGIQSNGPINIESSFIGFNSTNGIAGGAIQSNETLTVSNSTLASNKSRGPAIQANDKTKISSSAIVFNERLEGGGAAGIEGSGPVTLADSIIAGNRTPDGTVNCGGAGPSLITTGGNVEDDSTCGPGPRDRANTAPGLGTLELHGGTTSVFNLLPGSAAIDFALSCPPTDQRGAPRPLGGGCDSGPFELEPPPATPRDETVFLLIGRGKVRINARGMGRIRLTCPQGEQSPPCSGTLRLKTRRAVEFHGKSKRVALAKATFELGAGSTKRVAVHLAPAKVDLIRREPAARKAVATARVFDAAGNAGLVERRLGVVPTRRR
jgi:hypothetical protein